MKRIVTLVFLLLACAAFAQNGQSWRSFFSYSNIVDIAESPTKVYAGAESAIFTKNTLSNELKTITSVDGLKAENVTAVHYSDQYHKTLVGNQNGLLIVINQDNSIVNVVDIVEETTIQPNKKKINSIYEYQGKAYIACDFGIAVFDLTTMEFGDTYRLGPVGAEIQVLQATVLNGWLYVATPFNGIRRAQLGNPFLNDYSQWTEHTPGNWDGIVTFQGQLFAAHLGGVVYRVQNDIYIAFGVMPSRTTDITVANGFMVVTSLNKVVVYNADLVQAAQINVLPPPYEDARFTCATVVNNKLFVGTEQWGMFSTRLDFINIERNTPDGPLRSNIFSLEQSNNTLWAVFGGYDINYVPTYSKYGISKFTPQGWLNIPYSDIAPLNPGGDITSLSDIVVNPVNPKEVWIGSFHNGLLKLQNNVPDTFYNIANTNTGSNDGLQTLHDPQDANFVSVRVNSLAYDNQGALWMTNGRVDEPLVVLRNGTWDRYSFEDVISNTFSNEYGEMVIDRNNTKWISTMKYGLIAFNENYDNKFIIIDEGTGNLPNEQVTSLAIDNNNQLWIGTRLGLRVLSNIEQFTSEDALTTRSIIIMEEGVAQELMYSQTITDIEVDGANNKWLATAGAGAFLVSPNGQETLFHFTKSNSPLPSNNINDIEIDPATGEVFFATDKGMVSYQGTSTKAAGDLNNVYIFPNPVRPGFEGDVNISGLIDNANVKITDIEGNLVYETTSEGGTVLWNTRAFNKYKVASGVYMVFIASEDGTETKVKKVMIVR